MEDIAHGCLCCARALLTYDRRLSVAMAFGMLWWAILLLGMFAGTAIAQDQLTESRFAGKPAQDIRIGVFATVKKDCTPGPLPTVKLHQAPRNGVVVVKRGRVRATNFKNCLAIEVPAFIASYKSRPDFKGEEELELEVIGANGKSRIQKVRVNVNGSPHQPDVQRPSRQQI